MAPLGFRRFLIKLAIRKIPTRSSWSICKGGLFLCCKGNENLKKTATKFRASRRLGFEDTKITSCFLQKWNAAKLILELSSKVVHLNLIVFFVSAELFEWFWKIRETIDNRVVFRRPWEEKDYFVCLADKQQKDGLTMKWRNDHRSCDCDLRNRNVSPKNVFGASTGFEPTASALAMKTHTLGAGQFIESVIVPVIHVEK